MTVSGWYWLVPLAPLACTGAALWANHPALGRAPGPWRRLAIYLSRNVAQTAAEPLLPELRSRRYRMAPAALLAEVAEAARAARFRDVRFETPTRLHAVAVSRCLRFRDDLTVRVLAEPGGVTRLEARSASRIGRGDLAANQWHLRRLFAALDARPRAQSAHSDDR